MRTLQNLSLSRKLALPAALALLVTLAIVSFASHAMGSLAGQLAQLTDRKAVQLELALEAESLFNGAAVSEKNVILSSDPAIQTKTAASQVLTAAATLGREAETLRGSLGAFVERLRTV